MEVERASITEIRMELTSFQEKQSAAMRNLESLIKSEAGLRGYRLVKRESELATIAVKLNEFDASIAEAETEIKEHIKILDAERLVLLSKMEAHAVKAQALQAAEEQAKQIRYAIESAQKRLSAGEVRRTELRTENRTPQRPDLDNLSHGT